MFEEDRGNVSDVSATSGAVGDWTPFLLKLERETFKSAKLLSGKTTTTTTCWHKCTCTQDDVQQVDVDVNIEVQFHHSIFLLGLFVTVNHGLLI